MDGDLNQVEVKPVEQPVTQPQPVKPVKSGKASVIIMAIVIACLLGVIGAGVYFYLNQAKCTSTTSVVTPIENPTEAVDTNEGYLVLEDWNVKFKLPTDLGSNVITYQKTNDSYWGDYYEFSTERVSALGGDCAGLNYFYRRTEPITDPASAPDLAGKFGGYYYYVGHRQDVCSELETQAVHTGIVFPDMTMLKTFLGNVEPK